MFVLFASGAVGTGPSLASPLACPAPAVWPLLITVPLHPVLFGLSFLFRPNNHQPSVSLPFQNPHTFTMSAAIPAGGTWFDTIKRSFADVPVDAGNDDGISTTEFLEAAESLVTLFGVLCPSPCLQ